MMVCAILALELLLSWNQKHDAAQGWLALWALVATFLYAGHYVFFHHVYYFLPVSDTVYVFCNLAVYPLYLVYISELTETTPLSTRLDKLTVLLGLPVLIALVVWGLYATMSTADVEFFVRTYLYKGSHTGLTGLLLAQAIVHDVARGIFALQVVGVMVAGIRKIKRYNQHLKYLYADTDDKHLGTITVILWLLVITSLFSVLANAIGRYSFEDSLLLAFPSLLFSALLFCIGWTGLSVRSCIAEMQQEPQVAPRDSNRKDGTNSDYKQLAMQFEQLMNIEQVYLEHDLRLDTVVQRLGTNRTYLLAALKQETGLTFNEYVNRKRIAHAKQLMRSNPGILKSDVATRSGYNSISAFYRNLKNQST